MNSKTKYLFVTGGVASSLGKGVVAASLALLLERRGLKVGLQKFDPYLNIDPGTMNPCQHGEVFVLDDGTETDLDLGHYERFSSATLDGRSSVTMGKVYRRVLERERRGDYLGETVQVIPHVVNEARSFIHRNDVDVVIVEIGGTVGDIEGLPVLEAVRQLIREVGDSRAAVLHLTLLPYLSACGELKTKPTQHSILELRRVGLRPDFIVCRTETQSLTDDEKRKLALHCDVSPGNVYLLQNVNPIYAIPLDIFAAGLDAAVCERFDLEHSPPVMADWEDYVIRSRSRGRMPVVRVAVIAKYDHTDAYKSVFEAIEHAGLSIGVRADVTWIDAEMLTGSVRDVEELENFDAILVPGGFGERGVQGKIRACQVARERLIPFFGICLGLQVAVIEVARNVCGLSDAHSTEFNPGTPHPVIAMLDGQHKVIDKGGTMRLGSFAAGPIPGTKFAVAYGDQDVIHERHRHRYEVNATYLGRLVKDGGLRTAAVNLSHTLIEAMELFDHPWFIGTQSHPEFLSSPIRPHPLFVGFLIAAKHRSEAR